MLSDQEVAARTETTLRMSNVTSDSAEQVSSYMTAIWNNFYDGSESLESFADKITALGAATASSSAEIAAGLQQFAAIGDTVGLSYDYAATALATVVAQTRQSESVVGNAFRTIFSRLQGLQLGETTEEGTDLNKYSSALAKVGVNIKDANGELKTMDQILNELGERWQGLSKDTQMALAQTVGGTRQYAQIIALMDNWEQFQRNLQVTQSSEGTLQKQADIYAESWEAAQKRVQAAWQSIYQDLISDKFFITILNGLEKVLKGVDSLIDSAGGLKGVLSGVAAIFTSVFSDKIVQSIKDTAYSIKMMTPQGRQEIENLRTKAWQEAAEMNIGSVTSEGAAQTDIIEKTADLQKTLIDNARNMSEEQLKINQLLLDGVKITNKNYLAKAKELDLLREESDEIEMQIYASSGKKGQFPLSSLGFQNKVENYTNNLSDLKDISNLLKNKGSIDELNEKILSLSENVDQVGKRDFQNFSNELRMALTNANGEIELTQDVTENALKKIKAFMYSLGADMENNLEESAEKMGITKEEAEKLYEAYRKLALAEREVDDAANKMSNAHIAAKEKIQQTATQVAFYAENLVACAQATSQLMFGINALSSIKDTLDDKTISLWDKFGKIISSLAMSLPMLYSGFLNLSSTLAKMFSITNWQAGLIIAAIGATIFAVKTLYDKFREETPEEKLEKAEEKLQEIQQSYQRLTSSLEEYRQVQDSLQDLEGLDKILAVEEENEKILDLIKNTDNWKDIIGDITYDTNGLIEISNKEQEQLELSLKIEESLARRAQLEAKIAQIKAEPFKEYEGPRIVTGLNTDITENVIETLQNADIDYTKLVGGLNIQGRSNNDFFTEFNKIEALFADSDDWNTIKQQLFDIFSNVQDATNFIHLISDNTSNLELLKAANVEYGRASIGEAAEVATPFSPVQNALYEQFALLTQEEQDLILKLLDQGYSITLAWADASNIIQEATNSYKASLLDNVMSISEAQGDSAKQQEIVDWFNTLNEEDLKLLATLDINRDTSLEEIQKALEDLQHEITFEIDPDVDEEELISLTDYIYRNIENIDELSNHLADCKSEVNKIAHAILRFDDAIQDVSENYEEWMDMLNSGSVQDAAKAANQLQDAYGDLLDIDGTVLSNDFLTSVEYLDLMKAAIEGDEEAYQRLQQEANKDIVTHLELIDDDFYNRVNELQQYLDSQSFQDLEIGANLDTGNFLNQLTELVNAAHMTAEQATAFLANMGIDAEVKQIPAETREVAETETEWVPGEYEFITEPTGGEENPGSSFTYAQLKTPGFWRTRPSGHIEESSPSAFTLEVTSAHKSSGGNFKFSQANHGGGANGAGNTRGKSGGGGGGGSSKKPTVKEHKEKVKEEDRYHNIKESIDDLTTALNRLDKTKDRAFGKAKLKYMDQEIEKLEKQIDLTDKYIGEIKQYLALDRGNLETIGMGAAFDDQGMLTNYEQVLQNIVSAYNGAVDTYNAAVDTYNVSAQEDADNDALDASEKALEQAKKRYDENKEILKQYEDTYNLLQEQVDKRIDQVNELYDAKLAKVKWKVDVELELNEDDTKLLEWLYKYLGKSIDHGADKIANLSKQMDSFADSIEHVQSGLQDFFEGHDTSFKFADSSPLGLLTELQDYMRKENLASEITEEDAKFLRDSIDQLRDYYDKIYDSWVEAHEVIREAWDENMDAIDKTMEKYDHLNDKLDLFNSIIDLSSRKLLKMSTRDIQQLSQATVDLAQKQLASSKAIMDNIELQVEAQRLRVEQAQTEDERAQELLTLEAMEKDYWEAVNDYAKNYENTLKKVNDQFERTKDLMREDYMASFGNGLGLEFLSEEFDRQQELEHLYLDDYEKYHELNKSVKELQDSINNTTNALIQGKMYDLLDELNAAQQEGVQISEVQAEIYARRVALLQAEAQLLDAQNTKSAVRMTRDNEGNFSYTYTADQEKIGEARETYADRFYELLKYMRDSEEDYQAQMIQLWEDYIDDVIDLMDRYKDDQEAYEQALEQLNDDYAIKSQWLVNEMDMLYGEMGRLRDEDWKDVEDITGLHLANQDDFIAAFEDSIYGRLVPGYQTAEDEMRTWQEVSEETCEVALEAVQTWQEEVAETLEAAGDDVDTFRDNVDQDLDDIEQKADEVSEEVDRRLEEMNSTMDSVISKAEEMDRNWATYLADMRSEIGATVSALNELLRLLNETTSANWSFPTGEAAGGAGGWDGGSEGWDGSGEWSGDNWEDNSGIVNTGPGSVTVNNYNNSNGAWGSAYNNGYTVADQSIRGKSQGSIFSSGYLERYASGGYTGSWNNSPKLALLDEKELVLNQNDTANILSAVDIIRNLSDNFGSLFNPRLSTAGIGAIGLGTLEQQVHIDASFPNVRDHSEIEIALNNLINSASQYVNRK